MLTVRLCFPLESVRGERLSMQKLISLQMWEVSRHLTNNREFSNLPRKYKITISGCCIQCSQPDINDVGIFGLRKADGEAGFGIKVALHVHVPGMERSEAEELVRKADVVCPYSHATKGNIEKTLEVV